MPLIKVNTKGGNRPIRAWYGSFSSRKPNSESQIAIVYAYGDCISLAFKRAAGKNGGGEDNLDDEDSRVVVKQDVLPSIHGREIMCVLGLQGGSTLLTGSEDTTFKVLKVGPDGLLEVAQTFSQHEASVRAFAKCKIPLSFQQQTSDGGPLSRQTHLVVSAGSKMQAHLFAWSSALGLQHLCKYS